METPSYCAACEAELAGAYCAACGEPRPRSDHESLGAVLREQVHEVTSVDGKLWRSLRLLFSPGRLTEDYFSGRRTRTLRPIRLFLIANVLLFFALGFLQRNPLMGELATQKGIIGERGMSTVEDAREAWGGDPVVFEALFNQRARTLASTLIALMIPAFALLFAIAFRWSSGARTFVFATHTLTALVAGYLLLLGVVTFSVVLLRVFGIDAVPGPWLNLPLALVVAVAAVTYLAVGARRVYGVSTPRAWLGGLAVTVGGIPTVLWAYRVLLFWITLWTLDLPTI